MLVELLHSLMNLVLPPISFITLLFFVPPYYFFKFFLSAINYIFSENLSGKVVLITGASSGIGEQLAYQYARRGANLVLIARRKKALEEAADNARYHGAPEVLAIKADVSKVDECRRFVDEAVNHFGRLDHLVNNAGISSVCMFEESGDIANFAPIMDINFWGAVYPTYFAVPQLRKSNGRIVVMASAAGWLPTPRMSYYNASKAALINFFDGLRTEFGSDIKITIATPGYIESELTQGKFLMKDGNMKVDQDMRDVQIGPAPVLRAEQCARGIVNSACRGDRYVTEPAWFKAAYLWRVFCPELLEWMMRMLLMTGTGSSETDALSKKILDITGAKYFFYPDSIRAQSELKTD
ncbi:hypothetical protein MKW98_030411 [Papaver atlanticum]|uniref:Uncharacterized protein n=1 Tax=Papaver atlanticum TaxID=357466 RepID=A0AAD4SR97_9MAGN|nr:hypothetical protein MKW98_030411 [Papaver atlanticum]